MTQNLAKCIFASIFLLFCFTACVPAYRILGILHTSARSHYIVGSSLMKGLARKGHEVTVLSPFPLKQPMENFVDVPLYKVIEVMQHKMKSLFAMNEANIIDNIADLHNFGLQITEAVLDEPGVKALMNSNQTFDVVICEVFLSEALYGLAEHFKAPLIGLGTFGAIAWNTDMVGSPSPPSYVPAAMLKFTDHMTLLERIGNLAYLTFERALMEFWYLPRQVALYEKHFPHLKRSLHEVRRDTALVLLNQHVSLSFPRPYVPNQIEVGGMHINSKRKPLPADIQKFIEEAKHGVIYFSMGSNLKSKDIPINKRTAILDTFRSIKQRVLWKFEDPNLENKPNNLYISDWFPQDDILAHENVRAFITHGGLLSTTESIYHGKPFIGIPIFGDQYLNMGRAEMYGYGIQLDYQKLTTKSFKEAIRRILNEQSYTNKVREISTRFRDQPMSPLERAIYWVEHVARTDGAKYLHCAGQDLNFIQYHSIDTILILYGGLILIVILFVLFLRFILRSIISGFSPKSKKLKKH